MEGGGGEGGGKGKVPGGYSRIDLFSVCREMF